MQDFLFDSSFYSVQALSRERLETLADWAGLEHDTHWYTCVGWALMEGEFYDAAISYYNEALAHDSGAWVAMEGLARSYGDQEQYHLAISWQKKAIAAIPECLASIISYLYPRIADWAGYIGERRMALEAAEEGFRAGPFVALAQERYLRELCIQDRTDTIIEIVGFLNDTISENDGYSFLSRFFIAGCNAYHAIGKAFREKDQPTWILDVMNESLERVDQDDPYEIKPFLLLSMAEFQYHWYDDREDEVIKLAERFLDYLTQSEQLQQTYANPWKRTRNMLAQLYFDRATTLYDAAHEISAQATIYADKLKAFAVSVHTSVAEDYDGFDFFREDYPSLLWGRWLRDYRHAEEKAWRRCFKARLLEEMNSLDDDDPANDMDGMQSLAVSLFHAKDRRNAAAILAILFKPLEGAKAKESEKEKEERNRVESVQVDNSLIEPPGTNAAIDRNGVQGEIRAAIKQ